MSPCRKVVGNYGLEKSSAYGGVDQERPGGQGQQDEAPGGP